MAKIGDLCERKENLTIEWKIKEFSALSSERNICYYSHRFYFSGATWKLKLYPNGEPKSETNGSIAVYLMRASHGSPVTLNYTLGIKTVAMKKAFSKNYTHVFKEHDIGHGCSKIILKSILMTNKFRLLSQDTFTLFCTLKNSEKNNASVSAFNCLHDLSDSLAGIYKKSRRTDVLLNVNGGTIRAHRVILETRSPVFAAIFNQDTNDHQTEVSIEDIDVDKGAMEAIFIYIYTGQFQNLTFENVSSVYGAAKKYDIKDVKDMCMKFVTENVSVEDISEVIKFAELHQKEELRQRAIEYFICNGSKIKQTDQWKNFVKDNHLGAEFLTSVVKSLLLKKPIL